MWLRRRTLMAAALSLLPMGALAQGYPVTAGEHDGFTRVVVHAPPGIEWSLIAEGREQRLRLDPARDSYDLSRLFDRIPRNRLATADAAGGELSLMLGCDCPVTAWEERPGLVVLDIANPLPGAALALDPAPPESDRPEPPVQLPNLPLQPVPVSARALEPGVAQRIGESLARRHVSAAAPPVAAPPLPDREALIEELGVPIAQALSQGLLDPAAPTGTAPRSLLDPAGPLDADLPENLRITTVLDRPDPNAPALEIPDNSCPERDALAFLTQMDSEPFGTAFARYSRQLYGEFDQPDADARRALINLYLASGFGAEARRLLDGGSDPVEGRELLLGMADILEGRNSNSRMRLAQALECGGPVAVFALLAGPARDAVRGSEMALTFTQLPAGLRAVVGVSFAERLIAAGEHDAARIVAESLRRSAWVDAAQLAIVDAALARARGQQEAAAARLEFLPPGATNSQTIRRRLDLALEADQPVDGDYLAGAEAFASAEREAESGPELMAALIRLHARDGETHAGFDAFDRLQSWLPRTSENQAQLATLRDTLWRSLAQRGTDIILIRAILDRDDWREADLAPETRQALAMRLIDLGLPRPVIDLLPEPSSDTDAVLRARAALALGQPEEALGLLQVHDSANARATRAAALEATGDVVAAAAAYEALGVMDAATRATIAARDWSNLRDLQETAPPNAEGPDITRMLGRAPGDSLLPDPGPDAGRNPADPNELLEPMPVEEPRSGGIEAAPSGPARVQETAPAAATTPTTTPATTTARIAARDPISENEVRFDDLGVVSRGAALLEESTRLREAIAPMLGQTR